MKTIVRITAVFAIAAGVACLPAGAQCASGGVPPADPPPKCDLAINVTYKIPKVAETTHEFVLLGGSVDAAYNFRGPLHGFSVALDFSGETASNIEPGVNLNQFSLVAGPRYTLRLGGTHTHHPISFYGEALGGFDHAFDSLFPGPSAVTSSVNSAALQLGGGANIRVTRAWSIRLLEADFIMTSLPNTTNSRQYDLRLSNGVVFHF